VVDEPEATGLQLSPRTHPTEGFSLGVPTSWEVRLDEPVAFIAADPTTDQWGFRTNFVISCEALDDGMTMNDWQAGDEKGLDTTLFDYLLIDRQPVHVDGRSGLRRLGQHGVDGRAVTFEQWTTVDGDRGLTLTASGSTLAYPALSPLFAAVAASFRITGSVRA
jgi:hypothetical protein